MISLFGVSHHQHALQQLEKIVLPWSDIPDALRSLEQETGIKEALILSTCNRLFSYDTTPQAIAAWLSKRCQLSVHKNLIYLPIVFKSKGMGGASFAPGCLRP